MARKKRIKKKNTRNKNPNPIAKIIVVLLAVMLTINMYMIIDYFTVNKADLLTGHTTMSYMREDEDFESYGRYLYKLYEPQLVDIFTAFAEVQFTHNYTIGEYDCNNYSIDVFDRLYQKDIQAFIIDGENTNISADKDQYHRYIAIAFEPQNGLPIKHTEFSPYSFIVLKNANKKTGEYLLERYAID